MIGLDTNLLVRYLAQDDPVQSAVATDVMESRLTQHEPGFISVVAIAETVWVLDQAYRLGKEGIVNAVERMLRAETLVVERESEVFTAMTALREGRGEFGDALIGALSVRASCSRILTFDHRALRLPGFELP
jgi:predicted nucleic-acid-binding protein